MDTWPVPISADDRDFDRKVMRHLHRPPAARAPGDGATTTPVPGSGAVTGDVTAPGAGGTSGVAADPPVSPAERQAPVAPVPGAGEKPANFMILVIPVVSALVIVLCWIRYATTHNGWWLGALAALLVLAALVWVSAVKRAFARTRGHLAARLPGVIGHGVGIVREADVASPFDETGVSDTVAAHLTLSVTPVRGTPFRAAVDAVYGTSDAEKLIPGAHGPVRYLHSDPEHTVVIETRLDEEKVRRIYRAAALN